LGRLVRECAAWKEERSRGGEEERRRGRKEICHVRVALDATLNGVRVRSRIRVHNPAPTQLIAALPPSALNTVATFSRIQHIAYSIQHTHDTHASHANTQRSRENPRKQ